MDIDQQEFAAALAKGSGRAMILLGQAAETNRFTDDLVHACLCNLAYDRQCEHERSEYLARLIAASGDRNAIFTVLAPRLGASADDGVDIPQLFAVLARLAAEGGDPDRSMLRQAFSDLTADDQLDCMEALVRLDGLPALVLCAERLSPQLSEQGWRIAGLVEALKEHDGFAARPTLVSASAEHPQLGLLTAYLKANEQSVAPGIDEPYDFSEIRSALVHGKRPSGGWLRKLTETEWQILAKDLGLQTDETRVLPYLELFARRRLPRDPQHFVRWANSSNPRVSSIAARALGRTKDPFVRKLALERLQNGDPSGVRLLLSNYEPGDLATIEPLLGEAVDDDKAHDLGLGILDLIGENDIPYEESRATLVLLYERTPCSMCRRDAVSKLVKAGQVPSSIAEECRFDADPDTIRLFSAEC